MIQGTGRFESCRSVHGLFLCTACTVFCCFMCTLDLVASDCNANGVLDAEDLSSCESKDCNANGIPDECDIARVTRGFDVKRHDVFQSDLRRGAALDLDGDGDLELAVTQGDLDRVRVFRNDDGTLAPAAILTAGRQPHAVQSIDWDVDGDLDLLVSNFTSGSVAFHENAGDGTFRPGLDLATVGLTDFIAMDMDGDGDTDLAGAGEYYVYVWIRDAEGLSLDPLQLFADNSQFFRFLATDLEGDALMDILVPGRSNVLVLSQESPGAFEPVRVLFQEGATLAAGDMDGDGDSDLFRAQGDLSGVLLNDGNGSFAGSRRFLRAGEVLEPKFLDFNGDALLDLAFIEGIDLSEQWLVVMHGQGTGILDQPIRTRLGSAYASFGFADMNGDGFQDVFVIVAQAIVVITSTEDSGLGDCNGNGVPNECEPDCNRNGEPDPCEIAAVRNRDRDENGVLDVCEPDCDGDGLVDAHEISGGSADDCDGDLLPDTCALAAPFELEWPATHPVGRSVYKNQVIDFDLDGDLDVLASRSDRDAGWALLRNLGERSFSAPSSLATGAWTDEILVPDVDLDGDPDIIIAGRGSSRLVVRKNHCGSWSADIPFDTGSNDPRIGSADLFGDPAPEIIVSRPDLHDAVVLPNLGGAFGEPLVVPQQGLSRGVRAGDMDGDGDQDLVGTGLVVRNLGNGSFGNVIPNLHNAEDLGELADVDLDGDVDVTFSMSGQLSVSVNRGNTFSRSDTGISMGFEFSTGDLDRDGDIDIVDGSGVTAVIANDGRGRYRLERTYALKGWDPHVDDVDGDGLEDVVATGFSEILVFWGRGAGQLLAPRCYPEFHASSISAGDLDGDGSLDFAGRDAVLWNDAAGGFESAPAAGLSGFPAFADLDGDGDLDIALADDSTTIALLENQGARQWMRAGMVVLSLPARRVLFLDVSGDGDRDLVAEVPEGISVHRKTGPFAFEPLFSQTNLGLTGIAGGDFDGDLDIDLAGFTGNCVLLLNSGDGTGWVRRALDSPCRHLEAADLDGDGDTDLVGASDMQVTLFRNDGGPSPARLPIDLGFLNISVMTAGELDGDGLPEVLLLDGNTSLLVLRGPVRPGVRSERLPWRWEASQLAVMDLGGDGRKDLVSHWNGRICTVKNLTRSLAADCNGNFIPDSCDIASGHSPDAAKDGVPDECESLLFHRGDADDDGEMIITDAIMVLEFLFKGGRAPGCSRAANADADGEINIGDPVRILTFLFLGGSPLPYPGPPGEPCGTSISPEEDLVGCERYESCGVSG